MEHARVHEAVAALQRGDVDAALESGLMEFTSNDLDQAGVSINDRERILTTMAKLHFAWDARERYRARQQRLDERARKREARRAQAPLGDGAVKPALPTAAANALAKALARAKGN
ncbi:hypothetical protein [Solilutibacter silvestris]|uniref:hypothetical protein n=1 Tax=Solilutibacter silvestris TaxID=1645665 RepID=UPI003D343544